VVLVLGAVVPLLLLFARKNDKFVFFKTHFPYRIYPAKTDARRGEDQARCWQMPLIAAHK
jgi:hypothetical protein